MAEEVHQRLKDIKKEIDKTVTYAESNVVALLKELCKKAPKGGVLLKMEYVNPSEFVVKKDGVIYDGISDTPENAISYIKVNLENFKHKQWGADWTDIDSYQSIVNAIAIGAEKSNIVLKGENLPKFPID